MKLLLIKSYCGESSRTGFMSKISANVVNKGGEGYVEITKDVKIYVKYNESAMMNFTNFNPSKIPADLIDSCISSKFNLYNIGDLSFKGMEVDGFQWLTNITLYDSKVYDTLSNAIEVFTKLAF